MALVLSFVVKTWLMQAFYIPSGSMEDTLVRDDRVIVSKLTPGPFDLNRGDVVVFQDPENWLDPVTPPRARPGRAALNSALTFVGLLPTDEGNHLIKRVIGLPGDHVSCDGQGGPLKVNGVAVNEPYLKPGDAPSLQGLRHHRAPGAGLGHGRPPLRLLRLPVPPRRRRRQGGLGPRTTSSSAAPSAWSGRCPPELARASQSRDVRQGPRRRSRRGSPAVHGRHRMAARTLSTKPSLRVERALQREGHRLLAGMDEVGRGALAGPVSVGVVVIDETCRSAPAGVKDSKLLTPLARERMVAPIRRWALAYAVGHASPAEIDAVGHHGRAAAGGHPRAGRGWTSYPTW